MCNMAFSVYANLLTWPTIWDFFCNSDLADIYCTDFNKGNGVEKLNVVKTSVQTKATPTVLSIKTPALLYSLLS